MVSTMTLILAEVSIKFIKAADCHSFTRTENVKATTASKSTDISFSESALSADLTTGIKARILIITKIKSIYQ